MMLQLLLRIRSLDDARAVAQLAAIYARRRAARLLLDHTGIGRVVVAEHAFRQHLARARRLRSQNYCVRHGCDSANCPPDEHEED